jgi:glycosyltransferase involved in cell wall biosynthesis
MRVNVTIPVFNEEAQLASSIGRLESFLKERLACASEIVIADNASTDRTPAIARKLGAEHSSVSVMCLKEKGRGRAVKAAWTESGADICSYMDVDLSTDLEAFPAMIEALVSGRFDLATGSRLLKGSRTRRGLKRELISRAYNLLVRAVFRTRFSDAQCGFKAISKAAAVHLLPLIEDNGWFMDTELLVLAEKLGYRIFDLPVRWVDDADSRVRILRTAMEDIKGIVRLRRRLRRGLDGAPARQSRIEQQK